MDDFERQIQEIIKKEAVKIEKRAKEIFIECIHEYLYDRYEPTWYDRTFQLEDSVTTEIQGYSILVYIDTDKLDYFSAYDRNRNVSIAVPFWLTATGHHDDTGINNWFHNYPASDFLEVAFERISKELGVKCEMILKKPPRV